MAPSRKRGEGRKSTGKAAKKDVPLTKDTLFNNLKKDLDATIRWEGMVENNEEGANESLDKAAKKLHESARTFIARPNDLPLKSTENRPQSLHLTDNQRLHVRKLYQEVEKAIRRDSKEQKPDQSADHSKDLPALEGFMKAFELDTGEEEEEVFWVPKKRTPFPGGPAPEEVLLEDDEMGKSLLAPALSRKYLANFATVESDFEVPEIEGLTNLKKLPLHSFEKRGGFKAALKR